MPHPAIARDRFTRWEPTLATNIRRGYAWHAYCACGWESERVKTADAARDLAHTHYRESHAGHSPNI